MSERPRPLAGTSRFSATRPRNLVIFAALLVLGLTAIYWPAVHGDILWDDAGHLTRLDLQSSEGLRRIWFEGGATQQYYPLLHTAFWLEYHIWGLDPVWYHLANIFWHSLSATLIVAISALLLSAMLSRPKGGLGTTGSSGTDTNIFTEAAPWLAGILFAVHPVAVESVAWISEQKNTLSAVLYLVAAYSYLRYDDRPKIRYYIFFGLFYIAAMACKTVTATLPAALLVVAWWRQGWPGVQRNFFRLAPWLAAGLAAGLYTAQVEKVYFVEVQARLNPASAEFSLSVIDRISLAGRAIFFYLGKIFVPQDFVFIYPRWDFQHVASWQYLYPFGLVGLVLVLGLLARRRRGPLAALLIFVGTLFPALGFFDVYPFRYSYVADHFQYHACIAPIILAAVGICLFLRQWCEFFQITVVRWLGYAVLLVVPAMLAATSREYSYNYADAESLYRSVLARNPAAWMAHANLGLILVEKSGGLEEAMEHFRAAIALEPQNGELHNYLGSAIIHTRGDREAGLDEYRLAVRLSPNLPIAHLNLGIALMDDPREAEEAVRELETAVRLKPDLASAHTMLGIAESRSPARAAAAVQDLRQALALDPTSYEAHSSLGILLAAYPDRVGEAIRHLEQALALRPDSASAHYNLGYIFASNRRYREARTQFEAVLKLDPQNSDARTWLKKLADFL